MMLCLVKEKHFIYLYFVDIQSVDILFATLCHSNQSLSFFFLLFFFCNNAYTMKLLKLQ